MLQCHFAFLFSMCKALKGVYIVLNSISAVPIAVGFENFVPMAACSAFNSAVLAAVTPPVQTQLESGHQLEHPTGRQLFLQRPLVVLVISLISA